MHDGPVDVKRALSEIIGFGEMWKKRNKNKARESKPVASAWRNPVEDSLR
jgi:hypothetical protein